VVPTYGLTETASGATAMPTREARDHPGAAGHPLPGVRVTIDDPGTDGVGEIVVLTAARSSGSVGDDELRAAPDQSVHTGDLGRLDTDGRLWVVDRRLDRIVRGGENIAPAEVEAVLVEHPAITEAAVVARTDAALGHVPVAAIVVRQGDPTPGDEALTAHARSSLAGFKVPVAWVRLDALPRTDGGKLRRDVVRALVAGEPAGQLARPGGDAIGWRVTGGGPRHVLLLHGTLSTSQQLDRLAQALAGPGDVTVHAIDRRGSGTSRLRDPRPLDVATHVDDLRAYLDARAIDGADLVGCSFGGVLALEAASRIPDRVRAVVAYEPPYGQLADPETLAWFRRLAADTELAHAERGSAGAAETFLRAVAGDAAWDRLPDRARAFLESEGDGALADAGLRGLDPDGLARIACPVTVLTGSDSQSFYAPIADALAARIPGARRRTLAGLDHPAPITQPAAVAGAIRACLELPA
jgi:pimeloyl-ACP methyl ester carboxylesterase